MTLYGFLTEFSPIFRLLLKGHVFGLFVYLERPFAFHLHAIKRFLHNHLLRAVYAYGTVSFTTVACLRKKKRCQNLFDDEARDEVIRIFSCPM